MLTKEINPEKLRAYTIVKTIEYEIEIIAASEDEAEGIAKASHHSSFECTGEAIEVVDDRRLDKEEIAEYVELKQIEYSRSPLFELERNHPEKYQEFMNAPFKYAIVDTGGSGDDVWAYVDQLNEYRGMHIRVIEWIASDEALSKEEMIVLLEENAVKEAETRGDWELGTLQGVYELTMLDIPSVRFNDRTELYIIGEKEE
jgi:hypothetical protein